MRLFKRKLHWYVWSFVRGEMQGSAYIGYDSKSLTKGDVLAAKQFAGMPADSIVVGASYLGRMTKDKFAPES